MEVNIVGTETQVTPSTLKNFLIDLEQLHTRSIDLNYKTNTIYESLYLEYNTKDVVEEEYCPSSENILKQCTPPNDEKTIVNYLYDILNNIDNTIYNTHETLNSIHNIIE